MSRAGSEPVTREVMYGAVKNLARKNAPLLCTARSFQQPLQTDRRGESSTFMQE